MDDQELRQRISEIRWFHSIDFGNGIRSEGRKSESWLRDEADAYFGSLSLRGRSMLDVGAWDGFFSFEAKRRGADQVLATDKFVWESLGRDGFELARSHLPTQVDALQIDVGDLSVDRVGRFDIVLFAGVFYHLFEGPRLLQQIANLASHLLIVETHLDLTDVAQPAMAYYPGASLEGDATNFWGPNPALIWHFVAEKGFDEIFFRPHPGHEKNVGRGIFLCFRDQASRDLLDFQADKFHALRQPPGRTRAGFVAKRTARNAWRLLTKRPLV